MRHRIAGKQLSRTPSHRVAMRRNMAASVIEHGAVRTTEAKAKEVRRFVERLITMARKGTLHARRQVIALLGDRNMVDEEGELQEKTVVQKLFDEIAPRYANRPGGYTRIIRLSDHRIGDGGTQVLLQLLEEGQTHAREEAAGRGRRKRRAAKRREAVAETAEQRQTEPAGDADADEQQPDQGPSDEAQPQDKAQATEKQTRKKDKKKQ